MQGRLSRRRFLELTGATAACGLVGTTASVAAGSRSSQVPPGVAWRRTYDDYPLDAAAAAHGGGYVVVGRGQHPQSEYPKIIDSGDPVRLAIVNEHGTVRQRRELYPDIPDEALWARADVVRTDDGYAVATGPWFAKLDTELTVRTTGVAAGEAVEGTSLPEANRTTLVVELPDGIVVATEKDAHDYAMTRVVGFGPDGELQWVKTYGPEPATWLEFLLADETGLVVGGRTSDPWLASIAPDGTERWHTIVADAPDGVGAAATRDDRGITLSGGGSLVRLTSSRSIDWQRSYAPFGGSYDGQLTRTADGGYLIAARVDLDRIAVGRTDSAARLLWSREYTVVDEGSVNMHGFLERAPGEHLLVGRRRKSMTGWAVLLSDEPPPTPRTHTPTLPGTASRTAIDSATPPPVTDSPTLRSATTTTTDSTTTTVPGFGFGAALVGIAGGLLARRR